MKICSLCCTKSIRYTWISCASLGKNQGCACCMLRCFDTGWCIMGRIDPQKMLQPGTTYWDKSSYIDVYKRSNASSFRVYFMKKDNAPFSKCNTSEVNDVFIIDQGENLHGNWILSNYSPGTYIQV